ncbi:hypothetical protein [Moraxella lacunata]|uniref:hypothetical protein n=1 Tax=Moraxella lacunata TaxID=477 RepID=UPI003EE2555E
MPCVHAGRCGRYVRLLGCVRRMWAWAIATNDLADYPVGRAYLHKQIGLRRYRVGVEVLAWDFIF